MVAEIMIEFAKLTGLSPVRFPPRRYLWTDAYAVCNFLGLYRQTNDEHYKDLAMLLVHQVHATLGRHRRDDPRTGWISGLSEEEGRRHPTKGGLRIGKEMGERRPGEPFDERLEWDRDGQYYHYLTQWMHALASVSRVTGDSTFNRWAIELAKTAHGKFTYTLPRRGGKRLYWKMSIDLSYPLVSSMGHHDPLDGVVTYSELRATAENYFGRSASPDLGAEIADMAVVCEGRDWTTDDPLGIGGLLVAAYRMAGLIVSGSFIRPDLLETVLHDSVAGLEHFAGHSPLNLPADYRLAFREFGLSIGLQAIQRLQGLIGQYRDFFGNNRDVSSHIRSIREYAHLIEQINGFWLEQHNRESGSWAEHREINMVMLATSLSPDGYLSLL
ncbi:MAG TPA: hypothetical protein VFG09_13455 [Thermodesulfovibrionales bacterium]|nr:hypothetical protein [Thermodesulfovibrionales bacterium]